MEEPLVTDLTTLASDYIDTLDRDKRIVAARYIVSLKESPKEVRDMGFLQYVAYRRDRAEKTP